MADETPPIPIIGGTGALGFGLALRWAKAGAATVIGSRDAGRAGEAAERVRAAVPGASVEGLVNDEAARQGPVVFLTVPFRAQSENLNNLRGALTDGQATVGFEVCIKHVAPAAEGATCTATARLREVVDERKWRFDVEVREGERTLGVGTHERRVVKRAG